MTVLTAEGAATESGQPHRITVEGDGQRVGLVQPVGKAGQADALGMVAYRDGRERRRR